MNYTNELIKRAMSFGKALSVEYDEKTFRYKVSIEMVVYKEQHLRMSIFGLGFTIDDACYDFIRKCRGQQLENPITNQIMEVV